MAGPEQIHMADVERAATLVQPQLTGARVEQHQFVIALGAGFAIAAGLVADLADRSAGRTHIPLRPFNSYPIIVCGKTLHEVASVVVKWPCPQG